MSHPDHHQYKAPPITEAVIGLSFDAPPDYDEALVDSLAETFLENGFVEKRFLKKSSGTVRLTPGQAAEQAFTEQIVGAAFRTKDRSRVFQVREDRFIFSALKPYPGWSTLQPAARSAWEKLVGVIGDQKLVRIGVRYINQITIAVEEGLSLGFYLRTLPDVSADTPSGTNISAFDMGLVMPQKDIGAVCKLRQELLPAEEGKARLILDIDVLKTVDIPQEGDAIWRAIEELHEREYRIFESCITNKTRELFECH